MKLPNYIPNPLILSFLVFGLSCQPISDSADTPEEKEKPLFRLALPAETGITFNNTIKSYPYGNILIYQYFYNGGGVAVGDIDQDGLQDLFFTGNMAANTLYLNKGNLYFEDITSLAGITRKSKNTWATGVTMADVNGDGLLDIYVCYSGKLPPTSLANQLFINQGTDSLGQVRFLEQAEAYGLADEGYSTQATFFDYDNDHDLDMLLLNHDIVLPSNLDKYSISKILSQKANQVRVKLFRNDNNKFIDVSDRAGIAGHSLNYGLGAAISDIDQDGYPDIYVSNDYVAPDYLYMNNRDGTFTDGISEQLQLTSFYSMGNAITDINNDGFVDIYTLDMLPEDNKRQKLLYMPDNYELHDLLVEVGFHHQYMRNMLHLNNGNGTFSEIGQAAGISNTDWSWAPLFADFDNDGWKDLYITNGFLHDFTNQDFLKYQSSFHSTHTGELDGGNLLQLIEKMPSSDIRNYIFKNTGGTSFEKKNDEWGLSQSSNSNGAAFADLDNDGDIDLVSNNINQPAFLYENTLTSSESHYLQLSLIGEGGNTQGIGARVWVYTGNLVQYQEMFTSIGYQSSVPAMMYIGLDQAEVADSLLVKWPGGRQQVVRNIQSNQKIILRESEATVVKGPVKTANSLFSEVDPPIRFKHADVNVNDLKRQPLLLNPLSFSGPCMAQADVNMDGFPDIFIGGDQGQAARLFLGGDEGTYQEKEVPVFEKDKQHVDVAVAFVDINRDQRPDLYIGSGGYHNFLPDDPLLQDRLYINTGNGSFVKSSGLPAMLTSTGAVIATDLNGDGFSDLFVGGRVVPGRYPELPRSYLLINDGKGKFQDQTASLAPEIVRIGMVTDARWYDLDMDNQPELLLVGEWMPLTIFVSREGKWINETSRWIDDPLSGWWNSLLVEDLTNDGIPEILIGNQGINTQIQVSKDEPAELIYKDFDNNGSVDPIACSYVQGKSYPFVTRDELLDQISNKRTKFPTYASYADATIPEIFSEEELEGAGHLMINTLKTTLLQQNKNGKYVCKELPGEVQYAPVFSILPLDYNNDGNKDLLLFGNINQARLRFGKYSANYGMLLQGTKGGDFIYVPQYKSGLDIIGDVRSVLLDGDLILVGINQEQLQAYQLNRNEN